MDSADQPTSVDLYWDNTPNNESGFIIQRSVNGAAFSTIETTGADVTSYTDPNPPAGTTCEYQIAAFNAAGTSTYTPAGQVDIPALPTTPSNLTATVNNTDFAVTLSWTDAAMDEDGFEIQWSSDNSNDFTTIDAVEETGTTATSFTYVDSDPDLDGDNYYQIVAYQNPTDPNADIIESSPSNVVHANVIAAPVAVDDTVGALDNEDSLDPYTTPVGTTLTVSAANGVLANDYDPQNLPLSIYSFTQPTHGSVSVSPDGSFIYSPDTGFSGTAPIPFGPAIVAGMGEVVEPSCH